MDFPGSTIVQQNTRSEITQYMDFCLKSKAFYSIHCILKQKRSTFDDKPSCALSQTKEVVRNFVSELEENVEAVIYATAEHFDHDLDDNLNDDIGSGIGNDDNFIIFSR